MSAIQRRRTVTVDVGGVKVGSEHPVVVQSMTNTDTADAAGTADQVAALFEAGSQKVRITVNNDEAAAAKRIDIVYTGPRGAIVYGSDSQIATEPAGPSSTTSSSTSPRPRGGCRSVNRRRMNAGDPPYDLANAEDRASA